MDTSSELVRKLREFTERLDTGGKLTGVELAEVLTGIASHEITEGGPYVLSDGDYDIGLNLCIYRFLRSSNVSLPNLDAHIKDNLHKPYRSKFLTFDEIAEEVKVFHEGPKITYSSEEDLSVEEAEIMDAVRASLARRTADTTPDIKDGALHIIERTIFANADKQMSLMPLYIRQALGRKGNTFANTFLGELGFANACFWSSFIVYDDFWDEDEAAEPRLLPVSNFLARNYIRYFTEFHTKDSSFPKFVHSIMDKVDAANSWETIYCRTKIVEGNLVVPDELPKYDDFSIKYYPASGHVLGPVAMFLHLGYGIDSDEIKSLIDYFRHYLVAMQLNDDLHDWKEDLERGHISTVVAVLLGVWKHRHPSIKIINLTNDLSELENIFWYEVLEPVCKVIFYRCNESRNSLSRLDIFEDRKPLERFILRNEVAAQKALDEYELSRELLGALKSPKR